MTREVFAFFADYLIKPSFKLWIVDVVVVNPAFVTRVVRRIDIDAFDPAFVLRQQRFERRQIVPVDDPIPRLLRLPRLTRLPRLFTLKRVLFFKNAKRNVVMMIHNLVLPDPSQFRHIVDYLGFSRR